LENSENRKVRAFRFITGSEKQMYLTLSGIIEGSDSKEDWKGDLKP
jgi:hypothetical protein